MERIPRRQDPALGVPRRPAPESRDVGRRERKKLYDSAAWKRLRSHKLALNPLCEVCLERDEMTEAKHVHHREKLAERPELALSLDHLQALCHSCHSRLTGKGY